jgi:hypothetical protein
MQRDIPKKIDWRTDLREHRIVAAETRGVDAVCTRQAAGRNSVMNAKHDLAVGNETQSATPPARGDGSPGRNVWQWVNWGLALATVPAAALVMLFALGAVMSTAGCSDRSCPNLGRGGIDFGVAFYGAPVVAFVVLVVSFFTAKRRGGIAVPLCGWALLVADVALMAVSVSG